MRYLLPILLISMALSPSLNAAKAVNKKKRSPASEFQSLVGLSKYIVTYTQGYNKSEMRGRTGLGAETSTIGHPGFLCEKMSQDLEKHSTTLAQNCSGDLKSSSEISQNLNTALTYLADHLEHIYGTQDSSELYGRLGANHLSKLSNLNLCFKLIVQKMDFFKNEAFTAKPDGQRCADYNFINIEAEVERVNSAIRIRNSIIDEKFRYESERAQSNTNAGNWRLTEQKAGTRPSPIPEISLK